MLTKGKANILIDGQFGSTGKGLFAGYVAKNSEIDVAVTNAAPNSGHTYVDGDYKIVCKHIPVAGVLCPQSAIYLNAGAIIDPITLAAEIAKLDIDQKRIYIHPRAAIIHTKDIDAERNDSSSVTQIASTQSGVGTALANKINRHPDAVAKAFDWESCGLGDINVMHYPLNAAMSHGKTVFIEVPQGFDLGINEGLSYPFCTSRSVTVAQALADANIHPRFLGKVLMTLRTFPIRVGHIYDRNDPDMVIGHSGPFYPDSRELKWGDLGVTPERTTVTKRIRRVATFSMEQYRRACVNLVPDTIFLNFANYMEEDQLRALINEMWDEYKPTDMYTGYGADLSDVRPYPECGHAHPEVGQSEPPHGLI